jgi:hypothetical protein
MAVDNPDEHKVGYGKTPEHTRFQKGRSGNPKGRPPGSRKLTTTALLDEVLDEPVVANVHGKRITITKRLAMLKQLANKAASGDVNATKLLFTKICDIEEDAKVSLKEEADGEEAAQMGMLNRLTLEERVELRRLIAKAEGEPEPEKSQSIESAEAPVSLATGNGQRGQPELAPQKKVADGSAET